MSSTIENRQEILFLYEAKDCNPNGDPLDENRPRTDAETKVATVTDVRIKRTVRDYLYDVRGKEILIRDTFENDGTLRDGKGRASDFIAECGVDVKKANLSQIVEAVTKTILSNCIDARLFGSTLPVEVGPKKKGSIKLTGPVQFSAFNRSLHAVNPVFIQQTAAFASQKGKTQKTFAERWIVPYALISAYGVINEVAARTTRLSDEDVNLLLEGLWEGTNGLNTHSKMGHQSLLLMRVRYQPGRRIGALPERIDFVSDKQGTAVGSAKDYQIDISPLLAALRDAEDKVAGIDVIQDGRLMLTANGKTGTFSELAGESQLAVNPLEL